jgi:hypothetical protein
MFSLSYLLRKTELPRFRHHPTRPASLLRHPKLEELEQRDTPAPIGTGLAVLTGHLPVTTPILTTNASQVFTPQSTTANSAQAALVLAAPGTTTLSTFPGTTGTSFASSSNPGSFLPASSFPGFPTAEPGVTTIAPFLFSSTALPIPPGVPNPVRTGPVSPATLGPAASLPGTSPFTVEDMALSGGGGEATDTQGRPVETRIRDDAQLRIEASATQPPDVDALLVFVST